jgi:hypothetical protein
MLEERLKKKYLVVLFTLIVITSFVFQQWGKFKKHSFREKNHFDFPSRLMPLQADCFEIELQKYCAISFFVDPKDFDKKLSYPVYLFPIKNDGTIDGAILKFGSAEHIRHFTTLKTPWGEGVLFADHGTDHPHLNRGGKILLIVKNKKTNKLENMSSRLNLGRNFSFNVVAPKSLNGQYNDILIIPYNTNISKVVYLKATPNGYVDESHLLPLDWLNKSVCYMTGIAIDLYGRKTDDIFLGGCDQDIKNNPTLKDAILTWNGKKWIWNSMASIPLRQKQKGWGTVFLLKADLNQAGRNDIVALTHDWGFHQGIPQILMRDNHRSDIKFTNAKISNWPLRLSKAHHYLHKVVSYDIDNDGDLDLVGQINYIDQNFVVKPNIFVLMNNRGYWEYKDYVFDIPKEKFVLSIEKMKFVGRKKESLLFIFYDGDYKIVN